MSLCHVAHWRTLTHAHITLDACFGVASAQVMQLQQGVADAESRVQELEASEARLKTRVGDLERAEEVLHLSGGLITCGVCRTSWATRCNWEGDGW